MDKFKTNGDSIQLAEYETPFADVQITRNAPKEKQMENYNFSFLTEEDNPFKSTFEMPETAGAATPDKEAYTELLAELNDSEFETALYNLAAEAEDTYSSKISDETSMGNSFIPYAAQQINQYLEPLAMESERMIDRVSQHFTGNDLSDQNEASIEQFFNNLLAEEREFTPAQEQFFGSLFNKVKSVVKSGINLAKKGISAVGKLLPINIILGKLKKLIRPLLERVLKFAINKLPKNFRPYAQTLAKKMLNLETSYAGQGDQNYSPTSADLESIQYELDNNIANLVFSSDENESENYIQDYLSSPESFEREFSYETGGLDIPDIETARQKFINELKNLNEGESPQPAIENFLPAVLLAAQPIIKMAISIIGRPRIINFLAGLLSKLVARYIPQNIAKPLSAKIIDIGMSAIGFETYETNRNDLAYEAIANTIEETVNNMGTLNEALLNDQENLTSLALESFEDAAADSFPPSYIKEELRKTRQPGLWVLKPRKGPRHYYKKFTHVFSVNIDPAAAKSITSFKGVPLANFLQDKLGLDASKPVQARAHLYEAIEGTLLSRISRSENVPGLGKTQPFGWVQLHPLTVQAASLLLHEPRIGKKIPDQFLKSRHKTFVGERLYYLEINGAKLKLPHIVKRKIDIVAAGRKIETGKAAVPRSSDVQGVINLIRSEIRFNYYFSEEDAKSIVEKLNRNDYLGASITIRHSVKNVLNDLLIRNVSHKVKIIHEAVPEMYIDNISEENFSLPAAIGSLALNAGKEVLTKIVEKLVEKVSDLAYNAVVNYFKARSAEFKEAQALPDDGVTVKIIWSNIPGMSSIRAIINAIHGNLSVGNITDLVLPNIPAPEVKIAAGKIFD
ncbi:MAG: hypothetical protein WAM24_23825 [Ignavibacteriaceae bacterium]